MAVNIEDLRYWPILNFVPATALKNIRLVYVFGEIFEFWILYSKFYENQFLKLWELNVQESWHFISLSVVLSL